MARPKPWLKMWTEWVHDPKLIGQTLAERGSWSLLLSLAQECAADGYIVKGDGSPLSVEDIANCLHITKLPDFHSFTSMLTKMENQGSLSWDEGCLFINNFAERQALTASDTKEASRDRQRLHRAKLSESRETRDSADELKKEGHEDIPTPPLKEREGEGEGESHGKKLVTRNGKSVTFEPAIAEIAKLHEEYFGIISPVLSEKFKDFVENYRGPVEWIKEAFAEAVKYKNRRWQYVEAILYSWQEKGGPHADRREPGGERERAGAGQRDPLATYREAGWEVVGEDEPEAEAGNQDR